MANTDLKHIRDNPAYAAAQALMEQLSQKWQAERDAEGSIMAEWVNGATNSSAAAVERPGAVERAAAVANTSLDEWRPPQNLRVKLEQCRFRQDVLAAGINEQRRRMQALASELSGQACAQMRDAHAKAVKAVADAVRALDQASCAEVAVRTAVEDAGYSSSSLPPLFFAPAGWADEVDSGINHFLHEANHYIAKYNGTLDPSRKVVVRALSDLPSHGARSGEFVELPEDVANDLSRYGSVDLKAKPEHVPNATGPALRSPVAKVITKIAEAFDTGEILRG